MPFLLPKKSGIHRTACYALYRALLQQTSRVTATPLPFFRHSSDGEPPNDFQRTASQEQQDRRNSARAVFEVVREQFRQNAPIQSPRTITELLKLGYEALNVLHRVPAPLQPSSLTQLASGLAAARPRNEDLQNSCDATGQLTTPSGKLTRGPRVWRHPSTSTTQPHILSRPLPRTALSGKRCVPRLFTHTAVTFMRVKKPQPAYLSRFLNDRLKRSQRRLVVQDSLRHYWIPLAQAEDAWDQLVLPQLRRQPSPASPTTRAATHRDEQGSFAKIAEGMRRRIARVRAEEFARNQEWSERLWKIVQQERQLKLEEEGVLDPLRGRSKERMTIMQQQRREQKLRIAERAAAQAKAKAAKRIADGHREGEWRDRAIHEPSKAGGENLVGKNFVVRMET